MAFYYIVINCLYKKWANCWIHSRTFFPDAFLDGSRYLLCSHSRLSKLDSSTSPYIILNTMESSTAVGRYTESKERVRFTRVNFILKDRHLITFIGYRRPGFFTIRIKWVDKKASLQNIRQVHAGRWWWCRKTTNEYGFGIRLFDRNTQFTVGCNIFVYQKTPVDHTRILMQVQKGNNHRYHGSIDAGIKIYRNHGIRGLYLGFYPTLLR